MPDAAPLALLRRNIDQSPHQIKGVLKDPAIRKGIFDGVKEDDRKVVQAFVAQNAGNALKTKPKVSNRKMPILIQTDLLLNQSSAAPLNSMIFATSVACSFRFFWDVATAVARLPKLDGEFTQTLRVCGTTRPIPGSFLVITNLRRNLRASSFKHLPWSCRLRLGRSFVAVVKHKSSARRSSKDAEPAHCGHRRCAQLAISKAIIAESKDVEAHASCSLVCLWIPVRLRRQEHWNVPMDPPAPKKFYPQYWNATAETAEIQRDNVAYTEH